MSAAQDLVPPFDPTAYPNITGAQLLQLITGATPNTDTGFAIISNDVAGVPDVPDANTYTKFQRFLWIRRTATAVAAYVWNPAATNDPTYLKWVSINLSALGVGVIQGYMIADNTITDAKIISLDWSKLTGVPTSFTPGGAASGDLTGVYPNPSVAASAITTTKILDGAVTHSKLGAQAVEVPTDIKPAAVGYSILRTNAGATACEWLYALIAKLANPASAADVGKVVRVASPYTDGFELGEAANTYQRGYKSAACGTVSTATAIPFDNTVPQITEGAQIISAVFTPKKSTTTLRIFFSGWFYLSADNAYLTVALFNGIGTDALQAVGGASTNGGRPNCMTLDYTYAPGSVAPITFSVRFGPDAGSGATAYFGNVGTGVYGAAGKAFLVIEEIDGSVLP